MVGIVATLRTEDFGSAGSRRLVRAGKMPAEMYGKEGNFHIVLDAHDFSFTLRKLAIGQECEIVLDGKAYKCIFKALQENIMYDRLVHADFQIV